MILRHLLDGAVAVGVRFSVHARCWKTLQQLCTEQPGSYVHVNRNTVFLGKCVKCLEESVAKYKSCKGHRGNGGGALLADRMVLAH